MFTLDDEAPVVVDGTKPDTDLLSDSKPTPSPEDLLAGADDKVKKPKGSKKSKSTASKSGGKGSASKTKKDVGKSSSTKSSAKADTGKPAKKEAKKAPAKKSVGGKKGQSSSAATATASASSTKTTAKPRKKVERTGGEWIKATMAYPRVAVLAFFAGTKNAYAEAHKVAAAVLGKKDGTDKFIQEHLVPMHKSGLLLKHSEKGSDVVSYAPNPEKFAVRSKDIIRIIQKVPTDVSKGLSAGVIGGKVWGKKDSDDKWINVRYGRAAGAVLHNLAFVGAVGYKQEHDKAPKLWYRQGN